MLLQKKWEGKHPAIVTNYLKRNRKRSEPIIRWWKKKSGKKKAAYIAALKKSGQYKNTQVNNYKPGLISENDRLHELQCKLKERKAASNHKGK